MENLFSEVNLITERRFNFEDFQTLKNVWIDFQRKKATNKVFLLLSDNVATFGFWFVPFNFPVSEYDIVLKGKEIVELFYRIDNEIKINQKTKRLFIITSDTNDGCIFTVNGLITGYHKTMKHLFGKTLQEIKPWLKEQTNLVVKELEIKADTKIANK